MDITEEMTHAKEEYVDTKEHPYEPVSKLVYTKKELECMYTNHSDLVDFIKTKFKKFLMILLKLLKLNT